MKSSASWLAFLLVGFPSPSGVSGQNPPDKLTGFVLDATTKAGIPAYKHIDHISIINNQIYFLHQPDFGDKGKKLYYNDF